MTDSRDGLGHRPHAQPLGPPPALHRARRARRGGFFVALFAPPETLTPAAAGTWLARLLRPLLPVPHHLPDPALRPRARAHPGLPRALAPVRPLRVPSPSRAPWSRRCCRACSWRSSAHRAGLPRLRRALRRAARRRSTWNLVVRVRERADFALRPPNPLVPGVRRVMRNRVFRILLAVYVAGAHHRRDPRHADPLLHHLRAEAREPDLLALGLPVRLLRLGLRAAAGAGSGPRGASARSRSGWSSFVSGGHRLRSRCSSSARAQLLLDRRRARLGRQLLRRAPLPRAGDPGGRDRLRRAPHRQAPRGAVRRASGR